MRSWQAFANIGTHDPVGQLASSTLEGGRKIPISSNIFPQKTAGKAWPSTWSASTTQG